MDIKAVASYASTAVVATVKPVSNQAETVTPVADVVTAAANANTIQTAASSKSNNDQDGSTSSKDAEKKSELKLSKKDMEDITDGLNEFMSSMNTDLKFVLHNKMQELMVQVVDTKTHKVLREAPPKEVLDTLARIRDFVGALLDKKA